MYVTRALLRQSVWHGRRAAMGCALRAGALLLLHGGSAIVCASRFNFDVCAQMEAPASSPNAFDKAYPPWLCYYGGCICPKFNDWHHNRHNRCRRTARTDASTMAKRLVVIGGAGALGRGVISRFTRSSWKAISVDFAYAPATSGQFARDNRHADRLWFLGVQKE